MAKDNSKNTSKQFSELLAEVRSGKIAPFYVLMGEEPYYSDILSEEIVKASITEDEKGFNYHVLYGSDVTDAQILEYARRYPMMAARQVVMVREAQMIKKQDNFEHYFNSPQPSTVLIIVFTNKSMDKRTAVYKAAKSGGVVFESQTLKEEQVAGWIESYVREKSFTITPEASALMADYCGTELRKLVMESNKLISAVNETNSITAEDIEKNIGISREFNTFQLGNAILTKNSAKAFRIIAHFGTNPKQFPLVVTMGSLFYQFSGLLKFLAAGGRPGANSFSIASKAGINPYSAKEFEEASRYYSLRKTMEAIALLRRYDSMSKSSDRGEASDNDLLREMVSKIIF